MNGINLHFVNITLQSTLLLSNFNDLTSQKKKGGGGITRYEIHTQCL